jgi:hypothetical protein
MMRADLAQASAGETFGAMSAEGKADPIDADAGLRAIIKGGTFLPPISSSEADDLWKRLTPGYFRFEKIVAPNEAIKSDLNQL